MAEEIKGKAMEWNDTLLAEDDGKGFTLLPPGEYPFQVTKFERARFNGSAKMRACPQAKLTIEVGDAEVETTIVHNLYLVDTQKWKLCEFFRAIGMRKHGEAVQMDWSKVPSAIGRCKVGTRKWKGKDDKEHESNEITKFLDTSPDAPAAATGEDLTF